MYLRIFCFFVQAKEVNGVSYKIGVEMNDLVGRKSETTSKEMNIALSNL